MNTEKSETVILIPGLLYSARRCMAHLNNALQQAGYKTCSWNYRSGPYTVEELAAQFADYLHQHTHEMGKVHFIGFSLGGLITRLALLNGMPDQMGRIVMIGTPNRGAWLVKQLYEQKWMVHIYGKPVLDVPENAEWLLNAGVPQAEIGVIAGTRRFLWYSINAWINWLAHNPYEHDGTVEVHNTRLAEMSDFITVYASHTYICNHPEVIQQTMQFLQTGQFQRY